MAKVSVVIPCYNVAEYLKECLVSVINQTLKDIEIICINDGSTDCTLEILKEFAKKDDRIKIISRENKGVGHSRNEGIWNAKGDFISFIDPDDYYEYQDNLEILYKKATENNVKICGGEFSHLCNGKIDISDGKGSFFGYRFEKEGIICYKDWQFDYGYHRFIYDRKFLISNNIVFPSYKRFQDPLFFVQAMFKAEKFYAIQKSTYLLRCGHKKVNWAKDKMTDMLNGAEDNINFAKAHKLDKLYYLSFQRINEHIKEFKKSHIPFDIYLRILKLTNSCDVEICRQYDPNFKFDRNFLIKNILKKVFSLTNENNHKVICIAGIKLKIRRKKHA